MSDMLKVIIIGTVSPANHFRFYWQQKSTEKSNAIIYLL